MKYPLILGAGVLIGAGCLATAGLGGTRTADETLSEVLAGREQGTTTPCVNRRDLYGNRTVEDAIVFNSNRRTIYVNRPPAGCPSLEFGRALRARSPSTRMCEGDIVTVFDPVNGIEYGSCGLGPFTAYRRSS